MNSTYAQKSSTVQKAADSKAASVLDSSAQSESLQRKADMANDAAQREEAPRPNNTGMPDNLKAGIESLSGFSMDDVRVHYNSSKPATVQAFAYTQGTDIHVAPGQEKCLPHEAWHVAQQMAGRVSPTTNINGMPVNDNAALEHEADVMGEKAVQCKSEPCKKEKRIKENSDIMQFMCWTVLLKNRVNEGSTKQGVLRQQAKRQATSKMTDWPSPGNPETFNALLGNFAKAESDNYYVAFGSKKGEFSTSPLHKLKNFFEAVYQRKVLNSKKQTKDQLIQYFKNFSKDISISDYTSYHDAIEGVCSYLGESLEESIKIPDGKDNFKGSLEHIRDVAYSESHNGETVEYAFEKNMEEFARFQTFFLDKCADVLKYGWIDNNDNAIHQIAQDFLLFTKFDKQYQSLVGQKNSFAEFYYNAVFNNPIKPTFGDMDSNAKGKVIYPELNIYRTYDLTALQKKVGVGNLISLFGGGHGGALGTALNYVEERKANDVAVVKVTMKNVDISEYKLGSGSEGIDAKSEDKSLLPLRGGVEGSYPQFSFYFKSDRLLHDYLEKEGTFEVIYSRVSKDGGNDKHYTITDGVKSYIIKPDLNESGSNPKPNYECEVNFDTSEKKVSDVFKRCMLNWYLKIKTIDNIVTVGSQGKDFLKALYGYCVNEKIRIKESDMRNFLNQHYDRNKKEIRCGDDEFDDFFHNE